jgi:hypothetical protein
MHCIDVLSQQDLAAATEGYRYFGLQDVVELMEKARKVSSDEAAEAEAVFDKEYSRLASDEVLLGRFRARYQTHPDEFGPVDGG